MNRILKWGKGLILANALTIVPIFFFLQIDNVVEDLEPSTTLSYNEEGNTESIVLLEKELDDYIVAEKVTELNAYVRYNEFTNNSEEIRINRDKRYNELMKLRYEKYLKEKIDKQKTKTQSISRGGYETIYVTATAYISYCYKCQAITKTGYNVKNTIKYKGLSIIAVDPRIIPLNSVVKVYPNDREPFFAYCLDTGGKIKGNKIDYLISTNNTDKAFDFGIQENVKVEIVREGEN